MAWWVYKSNSLKRPYQRLWGDWDDFLKEAPRDGRGLNWGSAKVVPDLGKLKPGDYVLGYQTDRNELVVIATVTQAAGRDAKVYLRPVREVRLKIRPLKKLDSRIAKIPAFRPGPVRTLYPITEKDVALLLRAAGVPMPTPARPELEISDEEEAMVRQRLGGGFGTPEENRRVERAAIRAATDHFRKRGWQVQSVERERRGYDLECVRGKARLHVEVKGVGGESSTFVLTAREMQRARSDPHFRLCLVSDALKRPRVELFRKDQLDREFTFAVLAWKAGRKAGA